MMKNILIVCGDITNIGGAATNSYHLLKLISKTEGYNGIGLFISTLSPEEYTLDPDNLSNIYHLFLNDNVESKLLELKNLLPEIDIIFCKNYKIFPLVYKVFNCRIIYSPSGLRYVGLNILDKYIKDLDTTGVFWDKMKDYTLKETNNSYDFIKKNDKYLEKFVFNKADIIVCNSELTTSIVKSYFDYNNLDSWKLINPLYLSNITIQSDNYNDFDDRKYDIGFIAFSWKRSYKNYGLVLDIVNNNALSEKNIVIVGSNQLKDQYKNNITSYDFLDKKEINELFKTIKTIVIVSKYDSNPNVLVEGVNFGCNIVTSENTGNSEYIDSRLLVINYKNVSEWINRIELSLKKKYDYKGPYSSVIAKEFFLIINKYIWKK